MTENETMETWKIKSFHVEGKLHALRKTQDGIVVSFVMSPLDFPHQLALDPLGTRYMLALCAISDDERPVTEPPEETVPHESAARERYHSLSPEQQAVADAGILAAAPSFHNWLARERGIQGCNEDRAARYIRSYCGIISRKELETNPFARSRLKEIKTSFHLWRDYPNQQTSALPPAPERPPT